MATLTFTNPLDLQLKEAMVVPPPLQIYPANQQQHLEEARQGAMEKGIPALVGFGLCHDVCPHPSPSPGGDGGGSPPPPPWRSVTGSITPPTPDWGLSWGGPAWQCAGRPVEAITASRALTLCSGDDVFPALVGTYSCCIWTIVMCLLLSSLHCWV